MISSPHGLNYCYLIVVFFNISGLLFYTIFLGDSGDNTLKNISETDQNHAKKFIIGASEPNTLISSTDEGK